MTASSFLQYITSFIIMVNNDNLVNPSSRNIIQYELVEGLRHVMRYLQGTQSLPASFTPTICQNHSFGTNHTLN